MRKALVLSGGGPLAVAWACGMAAGLARAGVALNPVDFMLGTSAGAIVGVLLASGRDPSELADAILAEASGVPPPGAMRDYSSAALLRLPELFAMSHGGTAGCIDVGSYALSATVSETETDYVDRMQRVIGTQEWPDADIGLVAVDTANGTPAILRRDSGATIAAAVAASCCLPGLSPPVTIAGRRYMDGGMRSTANADLAAGFDAILVLCFHSPGQPGERILTRVRAQAETLRHGGARVCVLSPDPASLAAIGSRAMDVARRPDVVRAASAQGAADVDRVREFFDSQGSV
jgi:NTE family protein